MSVALVEISGKEAARVLMVVELDRLILDSLAFFLRVLDRMI
jgi:hypothetical protein